MKQMFKSMLLMLVVNFSACAQDTIQLRDGQKIVATIIELTELNVRYRRIDEVDGPIRNIVYRKVEVIHYANGNKETFVLVEDLATVKKEMRNDKPYYPKRRGPDRIPIDKDRILEGGLFVDFLPSVAITDQFSTGLMGMGGRLGKKWYFGKHAQRRHGFQLTYIRFNAYPIKGRKHHMYDVPGVFSPLGIGSTNAFKIKDKRGVEVNAQISPVILDVDIDPSLIKLGYMFGVDVKYRYNRFAIGLDFSRAELRSSNYLNMLSLTTGFKF